MPKSHEYKPPYYRGTSEEVTTKLKEAGESLTSAQQAAEGTIIRGIISRKFGQERDAQERLGKAKDLYEVLKNDIHDEADRYAQAYNSYREQLRICGEELGLSREPRDINAFVSAAEDLGGKEYDDTRQAEVIKAAVARAVLQDLFGDEVDSGTLLPATWDKSSIMKSSVNVLHGGSSFEEARARTEQVHSDSLLQISSGITEDGRGGGWSSSGPLSHKQTWAPVTPAIAKLVEIATPRWSYALSAREVFAIKTRQEDGSAVESRLISDSLFNVVPLEQAMIEQYPVEISVTLPGREPIRIEASTPERVLATIWDSAHLNFDTRNAFGLDLFGILHRIRDAVVTLHDGSRVPLLELTKEMLETQSRRTPETAAA